MTLSLSGSHPKDKGYHQGTFTASPPLCPKGTWLGDSEEEGDGIRDFTCANGTGTFTADFVGDSEHFVGNSNPKQPGSGPWTISSGTRKWAKLRGKGIATTLTSTGPDSSPIVFTSKWTGVVDFDVIAPSVKISSLKVTRAKTPRGNSKVAVSFTARDNVRTNVLTFRVSATSGQFFEAKVGTVSRGKGSAVFTVLGSEADRQLELNVHVFDPWENENTLTREIKLR